MIRTHREPLRRWTIHTVAGQVTAADIVRVMATYDHNPSELFVLWDFREADTTPISTTPISTTDIHRLVDAASRCAGLRESGKIAGVFSQDVGYGQGRMFQSYAELKGMPDIFQCFRDMKEAQEWLREDRR